MNSAPDERLDPRAARSKIAMLAAARRLLVTQGWDSVTHARVAEAAGVGRATVYRHWPTANALALEAASLEVEESSPPKTGDLRTDLNAELRYLCFALTHRGLKPLLLLLTERATYNVEFNQIRQQLHSRGVGPIRAVLGEAIRRKELDRNVDVDELISMLAGPIIYEIVMVNRPFSDRRIDELTDSLLRDYGYKKGKPKANVALRI
jgi:AcrR family transcriptional regulator